MFSVEQIEQIEFIKELSLVVTILRPSSEKNFHEDFHITHHPRNFLEYFHNCTSWMKNEKY
jgi:hypothetical protein